MKSDRKAYYRPYFRLNVQLLNTKFGKHFQKSVILKVSKKKRKLAAFLKVNCKKPP